MRGTGPRATVKKRRPSRRARACPSPCFGQSLRRGGQAPALRVFVACLLCASAGSCAVRDLAIPNYSARRCVRGTGPRATGMCACCAVHAGDRPPRDGDVRAARRRRALLLKHQAFEEDIQNVCIRDNAVRVYINFIRTGG